MSLDYKVLDPEYKVDEKSASAVKRDIQRDCDSLSKRIPADTETQPIFLVDLAKYGTTGMVTRILAYIPQSDNLYYTTGTFSGSDKLHKPIEGLNKEELFALSQEHSQRNLTPYAMLERLQEILTSQ